MADAIVVLNAGSSSIKFALFVDRDGELELDVGGQIEGLYTAPRFVARDRSGKVEAGRPGENGSSLDHGAAPTSGPTAKEKANEPEPANSPPDVAGRRSSTLLEQYGCGPIQFSGTDDGLYERHLLFDDVVDPAEAGPREKFEAIARSVKDVLSQRWVRTEQTYKRANPKRVYYISMEFLIGRSLANNVTNLLLDPLVKEVVEKKSLDWLGLLEQEPDAGLGNGGLGRLAACFLDSMATMELPAMGYGLRYEYGIFRQSLENGWQLERPDNWLRHPDPWEVARLGEQVEVKLNCAFELRGGSLRAVLGRPSTLIGIPFDRPVVGFGGKTINTLRLWAAAAPDFFDFQQFSGGDFVGALAETLAAESLTRVLYPDDSTSMGQGLRFVQEYFLVACSLADLVRRFRKSNADWSALPEKVAIQLNDTHPTLADPRADADPARRSTPRVGRGMGSHAAHARVHQPHPAARSPREVAARLVRGAAAAPSGDHPRDQSAPARLGSEPLPGRRGAGGAREPRRGRTPSARSAWPTWPSSARTAPTAWPRFTPSCCAA